MALVAARCPNCGDNIEVDKTKDAAICPSCGVAYVVEKAINNYGTIIQGENITIKGVDNFDRDSLLREALDSLSEPSGDQRKCGAKMAIEALDVVFKQGCLGKSFTNLLAAVKIVYARGTERIRSEEVIRITDLFRKTVETDKNGQDKSVPPELAQRLLKVFDYVVFDGWLAYIVGAPKVLSTRESYPTECDRMFALLDYIREFLGWGKSGGFIGDLDSESFRLFSRSFWADIARVLLEQLSLCYNEGYILTASSVQRVYNIANEYRDIKGVFRRERFSERLTPIHLGGEGVHVHRIEVRVNGIKYTQSASEHSFCERRFQLVCPKADRVIFDIGCSLGGFFFSVMAGKALGWGFWSFLGMVVMVSGIYSLSYRFEYKKRVYAEWLASPARGTEAPATTYEEFCAWMKKNSEAKSK